MSVTVEKPPEDQKPAEKKVKTKGNKSKFLFKKEKKEPFMSQDNALPQIELLFDKYGIDLADLYEKDVDQAEVIDHAADWILKRIMAGEVDIYLENGDIKVKQILKHVSGKGTVREIVYAGIEGHDNAAMPVGKTVNEYDRIYGLLGSMAEDSGNEAAIRQFKLTDLKTAVQLGFIFLLQ